MLVDLLQAAESQYVHLVFTLIFTGVLALGLRRLFRADLESGAEALALGSFLVGHSLLLTTVARLACLPSVFLIAGQPSVFPPLLEFVITPGYITAAVSTCFGFDGWSLVKALFGTILGYIELKALTIHRDTRLRRRIHPDGSRNVRSGRRVRRDADSHLRHHLRSAFNSPSLPCGGGDVLPMALGNGQLGREKIQESLRASMKAMVEWILEEEMTEHFQTR